MPARSSDLSTVQSEHSSLDLTPRTCSNFRSAMPVLINYQRHGLTQGCTRTASKSPTHSTGTALLPWRNNPKKSKNPCKTNPMRKTSLMRPLLGRPDTIPSGKDTGKPARSSDLCRGASRACKLLQHRSCSGKIYTESARRHHTLKYWPSKKNWKPAYHHTRPQSPPDSTRWGAVSPNKNIETI